MKPSFIRLLPTFAALTLATAAFAQTLPPPSSRPAAKGSGEDLENGLPPDIKRLAIGDAAPDFKLPGIDGRTYTLADFKDAPVLMVVFLSNHCPYSHAAETRLLPLVAEMKSRGLAVVAINPNHPDAVSITELGYSKYNDSFAEMKPYAQEAGFTFPYLYDGETQATAKAYGALATPHVFLFDRERKLRYAGRFDDNRFPGPEGVTSPDTRNALEAMFAGKPVPVPLTRPMGCSTKWISKKAKVNEGDEKWVHEPVTLEGIDAAGVAKLVANGSEKLRLINVWATWCAPCVEEFPELVKLTRQLGNRDFEVITISMDDPKQEARALKFLEDRHAAVPGRLKRSLQREGRTTNNYLYSGGTDALTAALDKEWPGPLPHTILVSPDGKIVYRHNGPLNFDELRTRIFAELGHYYK
jgi:peroxiredoxin